MLMCCWLLVFIMGSYENDLSFFTNSYGKEFFLALCKKPGGVEDFYTIFLMWIIMGAAMMVPTVIPVLVTYKDINSSSKNNIYGFWVLTLGFLIIWVFFALFISILQLILQSINILSLEGTILNPFFSSILLCLAALYQFSSIKNNCLKKCRSPLLFFMQYWHNNNYSLLLIGLRVGIFCLGCCWLLMTLGFVGGTMNFFFMGLGTILMTLEKLSKTGNHLNNVIALLLLSASFYIMSKELIFIFQGNIT